MEKLAIATTTIGEEFKNLARVTRPFLHQYAIKCRAKPVELPEMHLSYPDYNKLGVGELLNTFDRVLCVDIDILIRSDCPDIFKIVGPGKFAAFNEISHESQGFGDFFFEDIREIAERNDHEIPNLDTSRYLNAGVFLCDRSHKEIFLEKPKNDQGKIMAQGWLNLKIHEVNPPVFQLPECFNFFVRRGGHYLQEGFIIHYCGMGGPEQRTGLIKKDIPRLVKLGYLRDLRYNLLD